MNNEAKTMAKRLRAELAEQDLLISHAQALEMVAHLHGHRDWNTMAAVGAAAAPPPAPGAIPVFRMFDVERTLAFYVDFLGFSVAWEYRLTDHYPRYLEVVRDGVRLHLSEHHGDATPGSSVIIGVADAAALQRELVAKDYPYARPGLERPDWGLTVTVGDPASNRLIFMQPNDGDGERVPEHGGAIEHEITVPVAPDVAYAGFVDLGRWWDPRLTPDEASFRGVRVGAVGEPVVLLHEGSTFEIGTVLAREPGVRYAQTFTLALDPEHPTTLTAQLHAVDGGTRVSLRHDGWDAGNVAERGKFTEWPALLRRYAASLTG